MPNMSNRKVPVPEQEPLKRNKNFEEVSLGYTREMAEEEAQRCLHCKHRPCVSGCPVNVRIPEFIALIAQGDAAGAFEKIHETNSLPAVCGRVCPQESQCEAKCVRGIQGEPVAIGRLERYAADFNRQNSPQRPKKAETNGHKVAVVGAGPSGLTCAGDLAKLGYEVTVFEAFHVPGGVLMYGIPEFRLPKAIVENEIDNLRALGVNIMTNMVIGKTLTVDELFHDMGFEAVFIGSGAGLPRFMGIPGEGLVGVYSANEFLTRVNLMKAYRDDYDTPVKKAGSVAVIGGGNVAMDAARCAKRLGAETVSIVYRRSEEEMPARKEEIHHAKEEGIRFHLLTSPVAIHGNEKGAAEELECIEMELSEPDASGRRAPVPIKGTNFTLKADAVIMALGTSPNPLLGRTTPGLETDRRGCILVDEDSMMTRRDRIYAGGDAVTGAATVILAMGAGKQAAIAIDGQIRGKR
ncbi:MAG TPA: NADPH-dependent glutamate synthase [Clostridia bacterium]|nr:NADPH-dependent glutamate synthase [Clostridia bacterium]